MKTSALLLMVIAAYGANAQLAAIFSKVDRTRDCASWSSWGPCIWPVAVSRKAVRHFGSQTNDYLDQLSKECQTHWFYKLLRVKWGRALNNFFRYLKSVVKEKKPCGMCSYRQSCGKGGKKQCEVAPWKAGRKTSPFKVAEQVCDKGQGFSKRQDQYEACNANPRVLKRNKGTCTLWPSRVPKLTSKTEPGFLDPAFLNVVERLKWSKCVPEYKTVTKRENGRNRKVKVVASCRCCCYPYEPKKKNGKYMCTQMRGKPPAPGMG